MTTLQIEETSYFTSDNIISNATLANFHKICRFCLTLDNVKPIFDIPCKQASVQTIIFDCLSLKVDFEDHLPYNLCAACIVELTRSYKFKKRCIEVTEILRNAYSNRNFGKVEEIPLHSVNSDCYGTGTDNLIIISDETKNGCSLEDADSYNFTIKNEITDTPTICDDIISDGVNITNVIIKNEAIDVEVAVYHDDVLEDIGSDDLLIKNEDIRDELKNCKGNICDNLITKDEDIKDGLPIRNIILNDASNSLIIKNEEIKVTKTVHNDIAPGNINSANVVIKNEEITDKLVVYDFISKDSDCSKLVIKNGGLSNKDTNRNFDMSDNESENINNTRSCSDLMDENCKPRQYECPFCKKSFTREYFLTRHMSNHTAEKRHKCSVCEKSFSHKGHYNKHMFVHTGEKPHKCNICEKSCAQKSELKKHILTHTGEKPHKCSVCEKSFIQISGLKIHMLTHTGKRQHICNLCKKSFTNKYALKRHVLIHIGDNPQKCSVCKKLFSHESILKKHMLIHTDNKPYKCSVCEKSFLQRCYLNTHMLIHTGEKPFKCSVCEKPFNQKSNLNEHMLIHMDERHECNVCKKTFTHKYYLTKHMLNHTSKGHKCSVCEKSLVHKCDLKKHMLIHTGERSHKCSICDRAFLRKSDLKKHVNLHGRKTSFILYRNRSIKEVPDTG